VLANSLQHLLEGKVAGVLEFQMVRYTVDIPVEQGERKMTGHLSREISGAFGEGSE